MKPNKLQIPTSNIQIPEKHQAPSARKTSSTEHQTAKTTNAKSKLDLELGI